MASSAEVEAWMEGYLRAWDSNAPDDIRALFTEDAEYRTAPFEPPRTGHEQIVQGWIVDQDQPGDHAFTWQVIGEEAGSAFVQGETGYDDGRRYANLWVIRFAGDGRASSFTEWYMRIPEPGTHPNA